MNKKDRIAVVFSIAYGVITISLTASANRDAGALFLLTNIPLFAYWGYRFIKGDISFVGGKDDQSQ